MSKEIFTIETTVLDPTLTDWAAPLCGDFMFFNDSSLRVFINNFPVDPSSTYSVGANQGERCDTKFKINWSGQSAGNIYISYKRFKV